MLSLLTLVQHQSAPFQNLLRKQIDQNLGSFVVEEIDPDAF